MTAREKAEDAPSPIHWPSLAIALAIMLVGTVYPPLMTDARNQADHGLTLALLWAMSAGFVRGVGFVPRAAIWHGLFSGWACSVALLLAGAIRLLG